MAARAARRRLAQAQGSIGNDSRDLVFALVFIIHVYTSIIPDVKYLIQKCALVEARDVDEAVELSKGCPILERGGSVELRPIMSM